MNLARPNPLIRLMPSLTDVAFVMPIIFLFTVMEGMHTLLGDGDTGWHIRTGDWIRANGLVPQQDLFSYTMPDKPWFAWEWLWDVAASWAHQYWGLAGVAIPSMLLICVTFAALYRLVYRQCGNPLVAIGLTVLATSGSTIHWLARPHLVTMCLTVVFLTILIKVGEGNRKLLWWLPVFMVLWTNLHGGFIVGLVLIGAVGGGELLKAAVAADSDQRKTAARAFVPYALAGLGCLAASLINPYFYQLHVHIWKYLQDPYTANNINEFQSASFHWAQGPFLEVMLALGIVAVIWYSVRGNFGAVLLLLGWGHLALIAARNIPLFMLVAAPLVAVPVVAGLRALRTAPVAGWLRSAAENLEEIAGEFGSIERFGRVYLASAVVFLAVALAVNAPNAGEMLQAEFNQKMYPAAALAELDSAKRIFTHDEWGDYLIYQLYPSGRLVFVDGRSDFYGTEFEEEYADLMAVKYDWQKKLDRYEVDTVVLPPGAALATTMKESKQWRVVYDDGIAVIFRAQGHARHEQVSGSARAIGESRSPTASHTLEAYELSSFTN